VANYVLLALLIRVSDAARRPNTGRPEPLPSRPIEAAGVGS
jgi:hypothetical protein